MPSTGWRKRDGDSRQRHKRLRFGGVTLVSFAQAQVGGAISSRRVSSFNMTTLIVT